MSDRAAPRTVQAAPSGPAIEWISGPAPIEVAGRRLAACLREIAAIRPGAEIRLASPGGSALAAVVQAASALGALWSRIALTWVDERCVPLADPDSNRGAARRAGLLGADPVAGAPRAPLAAVPRPARIVPLFEDGDSPEAAVARYARRHADELEGGLDVVVLGLGADGHVASLFPDRPVPDGGPAAFVPDASKPPPRRITLTRAALVAARHTLLVATGEEKRAALGRLRAGDPRLSATGLPGLVVVTDLALESAPGGPR